MANIFNIDFSIVTERLMPHFWRKNTSGDDSTMLSYFRSMIAPVQDIADQLYLLQQETVTFLNYTGQHTPLEEYLNDNYDNTLRRITITENDVEGVDPIELFLTEETADIPLEIYLTGETPTIPVQMYIAPEAIEDNNFTINIPSGVSYDANTLDSQLRNYIEPNKNYNIVIF